MKKLICVLSVLLVSFHAFSKKDSKEDLKEKKKIEKEEHTFQKNRKKNPDDAKVYLEHANNLANTKTLVRDAQEYYLTALKKDSNNVLIYKDYGRYLLNQLHAVDDATHILGRGLKLAPNDDEMKNEMAIVNKTIAMRVADSLARDFGTTTLRKLNPDADYTGLSNFDSLGKLLSDKAYPNNYQNLSARFLADDKDLGPAEMYLMIVGYTKQEYYNAFNYNDISELRMLASQSLDSAIKMGIELSRKNPINPTLNWELMYYYRKKNDTVSANRYLKRIQQFFNGVLYSGDGTCAKPYISIWAKEEHNFINYLGYAKADSYSMGTCAGQMSEIFELTNPKTFKKDLICFNIKLIYLNSVKK